MSDFIVFVFIEPTTIDVGAMIISNNVKSITLFRPRQFLNDKRLIFLITIIAKKTGRSRASQDYFFIFLGPKVFPNQIDLGICEKRKKD